MMPQDWYEWLFVTLMLGVIVFSAVSAVALFLL